MANTMTLISSVTVGSGGASSIDFTSIPSTYTDLVLKVTARGTQAAIAADCYLKYNASGSGFSDRAIVGNGGTASSFSDTGAQMYWFSIPCASSTASTFGNAELYVPNYAGSNNKSSSSDAVTENNSSATGSAYAHLYAGLWANSAAINQITLTNSGGNFAQFSTAYLYGVKNA